MTPRFRRRLTATAVLTTLTLLVGLTLWRAFVARPGGRFPILADVPVARLPAERPARKVRPTLRAAVEAARAGQGDPSGVAFLVDLVEQVDLDAFGALLDERSLRERKSRRRKPFLDALTLVADDRQAGLLAALERLRVAGRVARYDPFRIVNRVAVVARDPAVVDELGLRPDVAMLIEDAAPDRSAREIEAGRSGPEAEAPVRIAMPRPSASKVDPRCWAIGAVGAPEAWKRGLDGRGVVVGLLDTGARGDHEQLRDNWRGAVQPARAEDSWYHPRDSDSRIPRDVAPHGTAVLAAAVGKNRPLRDGRPTAIGVAPGATWVAAAAYLEGRLDHVLFSAAADWMLFRAQPDIVIQTVTYRPEDADPMLGRIFSAMKAAEMVVVMAAGNHGPKVGRNYPPPNLVGLYPFGVAAFSVGSVGREDQVSEFSARGPSAQNFSGLLPQIVAPGEDLTVAFPLGSDALMRDYGTSYSVGYVAGAAAILLQAAPDLRPNALEHLLKTAARASGERKPNNSAGWGRLDVVAALKILDAQRASPRR